MLENIFTATPLEKMRFAILAMIFTIVWAVIMDTFNWVLIDQSIYFMQLAIFSLTSLAVILFWVFIMPKISPQKFSVNFSKNLFILIAGLSVAKFAIYSVQYDLSLLNVQYLYFVTFDFLTVGLSLFAISIMRGKSNAVAETNLDIQPEQIDQLYIEGELQNENLSLASSDQLLYIKANDNYSEFYTISEDGDIEHKLLRLTLKNIEAQLDCDYIVRCHKSYLVNLHHVKSIDGNVNNTQLSFKSFDVKVPLSRSRRDHISQTFDSLPK